VFRNVDGQVTLYNPDRVAFELRASLAATAEWVVCPEHVVIIHGGRGFNIRVDPTSLPAGAHYAEVQGYDVTRPDRCIIKNTCKY